MEEHARDNHHSCLLRYRQPAISGEQACRDVHPSAQLHFVRTVPFHHPDAPRGALRGRYRAGASHVEGLLGFYTACRLILCPALRGHGGDEVCPARDIHHGQVDDTRAVLRD